MCGKQRATTRKNILGASHRIKFTAASARNPSGNINWLLRPENWLFFRERLASGQKKARVNCGRRRHGRVMRPGRRVKRKKRQQMCKHANRTQLTLPCICCLLSVRCFDCRAFLQSGWAQRRRGYWFLACHTGSSARAPLPRGTHARPCAPALTRSFPELQRKKQRRPCVHPGCWLFDTLSHVIAAIPCAGE